MGDSHLAALKLGWDDVRNDHADLSITFFGAQRNLLLDLATEDRTLVPRNDELRETLVYLSGQDRIRVDDFDVFFIHALDICLLRLSFMLRGHKPLRYRHLPAQHLISDPAYTQVLRHFLDSSLALQLARLIHAIKPGAVIVLTPQPMPSEQIAHTEPFWRQVVRHNYQAGIGSDFLEMLDVLKDQNLHIAPQPEDTLASPVFSRQALSLGSVRLTPGLGDAHDETDMLHMNRLYGARVMQDLMEQARVLVGSASPLQPA